MYGIFLASLPLSARVCCTLFLLGIGLGSLAASLQASTAVGLSYGQVSAERAIDLSQLRHTAQTWIRTPLLIQTSHTHLFGQTLIAGLLGLLFLFSSLGEGKKAVIVALPFIGTMLDIGGMWLTRFVWSPCALLVLLGGSVFALGYLLIAGIAFYELWLQREVHP